MKTNTFVFLQMLKSLTHRLEQQGLRSTWDPKTATLSWIPQSSAVAQVFLRWQETDSWVQLALVTRHRCAPETSYADTALRLMRLAAVTPLLGWLIDEATGVIMLRLVHFARPGADLDIELLLQIVAASEELFATLHPQLTRIAAGLPLYDNDTKRDPLSQTMAKSLFQSFVE